jgi:hypothetical protein
MSFSFDVFGETTLVIAGTAGRGRIVIASGHDQSAKQLQYPLAQAN